MKRNLNLLPYNLCKVLKDLGFDYECLYYFNEYNEPIRSKNYENHNETEDKISCPEPHVVRQWFKDMLNIDMFIARLSNVTIPNLGYGFVVFFNSDEPDPQTYPYETYDEATIAAIIYIVNKLRNPDYTINNEQAN